MSEEAGSNVILLTISDNIDATSSGGYKLDATSEGIQITGKDPAGDFYGIQTLRGLISPAS